MKGVSTEFLRTSVTVATLADLSLVDTSGLVDGTFAYVAGAVNRFYYLVSTDAQVIASPTVLGTANSGVAGALPGRWIRIA